MENAVPKESDGATVDTTPSVIQEKRNFLRFTFWLNRLPMTAETIPVTKNTTCAVICKVKSGVKLVSMLGR
jgi:hypothetical protein